MMKLWEKLSDGKGSLTKQAQKLKKLEVKKQQPEEKHIKLAQKAQQLKKKQKAKANSGSLIKEVQNLTHFGIKPKKEIPANF